MNIIRFIEKVFNHNDPIKHCNMYKDIGCSYVDGIHCNFPYCSMNLNYVKKPKIFKFGR